jgi:sigma-E factor negative regulatory protein RseA
MVMSNEISRLMDGDLDDEASVDRVCAELRQSDALGTWACYHLIRDELRGTRPTTQGFSVRFAKRLAAEPTVLAPKRRVPRPVLAWAWAAAASVAAVGVVGWTAMSLTTSPPVAFAKAREAAAVTASQVRPRVLPQDYVIVHQEYSPATAFQGVQPYLRAVSAPGGDAR